MGEGHPGRLESLPHKDAWPTKKESAPQGGLPHKPARASSRILHPMDKSRWEIENQGFNDAKNRHGLEHICRHEANSLLVQWLILVLALRLERFYRLRYLHRGTHPVRTAMELLRLIWLDLSPLEAPTAVSRPARRLRFRSFPSPRAPVIPSRKSRPQKCPRPTHKLELARFLACRSIHV